MLERIKYGYNPKNAVPVTGLIVMVAIHIFIQSESCQLFAGGVYPGELYW